MKPEIEKSIAQLETQLAIAHAHAVRSKNPHVVGLVAALKGAATGIRKVGEAIPSIPTVPATCPHCGESLTVPPQDQSSSTRAPCESTAQRVAADSEPSAE